MRGLKTELFCENFFHYTVSNTSYKIINHKGMILERMIYFNQKFWGWGHDFHFIVFSEQTLCTCRLIWPQIVAHNTGNQNYKIGKRCKIVKKKAWEKAIFIFSLGLNLCPPDCQGPRCLWRKFQRRVSLQIWRFKSLQKSFFAKLKKGFLHIRTLGTKPLCCNFHLHHTFPPAQKIELAILYCCCCSGKLSNCCNLT